MERVPVEYALRAVYRAVRAGNDILDYKEEEFVKYYSTPQTSEHSKYCKLSIALPDGTFRDSFVITRDFDQWLRHQSRDLDVGSVHVTYEEFAKTYSVIEVDSDMIHVPTYLTKLWDDYVMDIYLGVASEMTLDDWPPELCKFVHAQSVSEDRHEFCARIADCYSSTTSIEERARMQIYHKMWTFADKVVCTQFPDTDLAFDYEAYEEETKFPWKYTKILEFVKNFYSQKKARTV